MLAAAAAAAAAPTQPYNPQGKQPTYSHSAFHFQGSSSVKCYYKIGFDLEDFAQLLANGNVPSTLKVG